MSDLTPTFTTTNSFNTTENNRENDAVISKILGDATNFERVSDLLAAYGPDAFKFDFTTAARKPGPGGYSLFAQAETWPALNMDGVDIGLVVTVLGPCGLNAMHTHRATEMQFNIGPGMIESNFIEQNDLQVVTNVKEPGTASFFPTGAFHMERNLNCTPTTFLSAFPSKDFARADLSDLVNFGSDILNATFRGLGTENLIQTGANLGSIVRGTAECRAACGLADDYDFNTLYPNLGYFTPEWYNTSTLVSSLTLPGAGSSPAASPAASSAPASSSSPAVARRHFRDFSVDESATTSAAVSHQFLTISENPLQPVVFGLTFISGALFIGLVFALLGLRRRNPVAGNF